MPKFKCSFKVTLTEEKTFIITDHEVDMPDEDCLDADGLPSKIAVKDNLHDMIYDAIGQGEFNPEKDGKLVETDYSNNGPTFIVVPSKVK